MDLLHFVVGMNSRTVLFVDFDSIHLFRTVITNLFRAAGWIRGSSRELFTEPNWHQMSEAFFHKLCKSVNHGSESGKNFVSIFVGVAQFDIKTQRNILEEK